METVKLCHSCGKPIGSDAPQGLCPSCLMQAGMFETGPETAAATPGFQPPSTSELQALFPALEILELIGRGGMGIVYKARQKQLDRIVALKILPPAIGKDPAFAERFAREAKALARLSHPGIVTLFEFGQAGELYFFLMEFVDGVNLRRLLQGCRVSPREALAIVPQICDALQYAHDQGIVHRDIKPENILLDRRGRVKVADFGIAKLVGLGMVPEAAPAPAEPSLTEAGKFIGTPGYMAPEQKEHPEAVDHRADIYALGVVFYQMLTGEMPGQQIEPPSHKVQIDVRLDEVVLRALEKNPERRYTQAQTLKTEVDTIAATPRAASTKPPATPAIHPAVKWAARLLGLLGFAFVLMFILAEGFPPVWKQPPAVQVELGAMVLMLIGLLLGWKRELAGAAFIATGWLIFGIAEKGWPPVPYTAFLIVAVLYGYLWWRRRAGAQAPAPSSTPPSPGVILAGRLALGLLLLGTLGTAALMTLSSRHEWALGFGALALAGALGCGSAARRTPMGRGVILASLVVFLGFGAMLLFLTEQLTTRAQMEALRAHQKLEEARRERALLGAKAQQDADESERAGTPPDLRYLAWQTDLSSTNPASVWLPDGSPATNAADLAILRLVTPVRCDSGQSGADAAAFLHLWFSHRLVDDQSLLRVEFRDANGKLIPAAANGMSGWQAVPRRQHRTADGWWTFTLAPGVISNTPASIKVKATYTVGKLDLLRNLAPGERGVISLGNGSQFNGLGQDYDGHAFVALAVDATQDADRQFAVTAVDDSNPNREYPGLPTIGASTSSSVRIERFSFPCALANVREFQIKTRPLRTVEFAHVVLDAHPAAEQKQP